MIFRIRLIGLVLAVLVQHLVWYLLYSRSFFSHPEYRVHPEKRYADYAPQGYISYLSVLGAGLQAWVLGRIIHLMAAYLWHAVLLGLFCSLLLVPVCVRKARSFHISLRHLGEDFIFDSVSYTVMGMVLFYFS